jgi:excisionase family DNA binding protein
MRVPSDIRTSIEDDVKKLTEAFCTGEISVDGMPLSDDFGEGLLHGLAADIIRYQLESRMLSLVLPYLSTFKWLSMQEACLYSRKSRKTLLKLIEEMKIYGTRPDGSGEYVIDRESIDAYYNEEKDNLLRRRAS